MPRKRTRTGSLTSLRGWGCNIAGLVLLGGILGCGTSVNQRCDLPSDNPYSAQSDSLGLEAFLALDPGIQAERRAMALSWLASVGQEVEPSRRIGALANAAGLAPDDPEPWLQLALIWRWLGDYIQTNRCLKNAAAAVRSLDDSGWAGGMRTPDYRRQAQRRTALIRAWLHWDRGEWQSGLDWALAGRKADPGSREVYRIKGLLEGALNRQTRAREAADDLRRKDHDDTYTDWILASLERSRGNYRGALGLLLPLMPKHEHAAELYRDRAEVAELLSEWNLAKRGYEESYYALPFRHTSCLTRQTFQRLEPGPRKSRLPIWLAFDRYYITGSLSAYAALAFDRYQAAATPGDQEFWAGQVVNATGILVRRNIHPAWSRRARGLVFAARDMPDRALEDLRRASRGLARAGRTDARVEATLGNLYLRRDNLGEALPRLRRAHELEPENGIIWGDLGLCLLKLGDGPGAAEALNQALRLAPESPTIWYNRGLMHLHTGDYDQAEADLAEAARLAPGNPEVGRLLQRIQVLKRK